MTPLLPQAERQLRSNCVVSPHWLANGGLSLYARAMGFAILRLQKLKAGAAVHRSLKHAFRTQDTPNADPGRLSENSHIGAQSVEEALAKFNDRLPKKVRKNAVLAVEFLITGSPEAMAGKSRQQQDQYFADALAWLKERHGAENVVYTGIHRDETTPHMYAYAVPLDDQGKLNCRSFYGGAAALSAMQTDFADRVGKKHQLERGVEGSKARHTTVREFYAGIERADRAMRPIRPEAVEPRTLSEGLFSKTKESSADVAERITEAVHAEFRPLVAAAGVTAIERKKRLQAEATAKAKADELAAAQPILDAIKGLSAADQAKLIEQATGLQRATQLAEEVRRRVDVLISEAAKRTASALGKFAELAQRAISVAGNWQGVKWPEVEVAYLDEARRTSIPQLAAVTTVVRYSPGHAQFDTKDLQAERISAAMPGHSAGPDEPARGPARGPER